MNPFPIWCSVRFPLNPLDFNGLCVLCVCAKSRFRGTGDKFERPGKSERRILHHHFSIVSRPRGRLGQGHSICFYCSVLHRHSNPADGQESSKSLWEAFANDDTKNGMAFKVKVKLYWPWRTSKRHTCPGLLSEHNKKAPKEKITLKEQRERNRG